MKKMGLQHLQAHFNVFLFISKGFFPAKSD